MRYKLWVFAFLSLWLSQHAIADSFCGFDEGLIGTKAIGYIAPASLEGNSYTKEACKLNAFETPSDETKPSVLSCTDFQHIPSIYVNNDESKDFNPIKNEYYQLQVFDAKNIWVQVALKSGDKKWIKQNSKRSSEFGFPYQYKTDEAAVLARGYQPTQGAIFEAPNLNKPDRYIGQYMRGLTDYWVDQNIPLDFFSHDVFKVLKQYNLFDSNHIEQGKLVTHYGEFFDIGYKVKAIIKDVEGREWLKAEEYLVIPYYRLWGYIEPKLKEQGLKFSDEDMAVLHNFDWEDRRSAAGRTVYFPYREPSGTITMVMTDGPECD